MGCIQYRSRQQAGFGQEVSLPTLFWSSHSEGVKGFRVLTEARKQPKAARVMQVRRRWWELVLQRRGQEI